MFPSSYPACYFRNEGFSLTGKEIELPWQPRAQHPFIYIGFDVRLAKSFIRSGKFFFQSKLCPRSIWYGVWFSDQKLRRAKKTQGESIAICHCHQYIDTPTAHPLHIFFYQAQLAFHHQSSWWLSLAFSASFFFYSEAKLALRSSHSFRFPFASSSRHLSPFLCFSIRLWNTLPASAISQSRSVSSFRSFLHSFYKADKFSLGLQLSLRPELVHLFFLLLVCFDFSSLGLRSSFFLFFFLYLFLSFSLLVFPVVLFLLYYRGESPD